MAHRRIGVVLAVSGERITADEVRRLDPAIDVRDVGRAEKGMDTGPVDGIGESEVLIASPGPLRFAELARHMPRLRWFHSAGTGVDRYGPVLRERPDVLVTNTRATHGLPSAEFVMGWIFSITKRFPHFHEARLRRDWEGGRTGPFRQVAGATVCVIGLGAIGGEVARLARACGMRVIGVRRRAAPHPHADEVFAAGRAGDAAAKADFVVIAAPLTDESRGLIDARFLARLRPDAWVLSVGRAAVIDEDALYDALARRRIAGAAIDVHWREPIPPESRWWSLENAIITPHRASMNDRQGAELLRLIGVNLKRYRAGEPLENLVDIRLGY